MTDRLYNKKQIQKMRNKTAQEHPQQKKGKPGKSAKPLRGDREEKVASPKGQPGEQYILGTRLAAKEKHSSINSGGGGGTSSQAKAAQRRLQMTHNITALDQHFE